MLFGITLLFRRRKKLIFGVIIDHGLGQNLVIPVALGGSQLFFHEGCDLIHV